MCGGSGTRLETTEEKPLYEVCGEPMIDHVLGALDQVSGIDRVHAAVSPRTSGTAAHLRNQQTPVSVVETPGKGYVEDLGVALGQVDGPALTTAADLPLLTRAHVRTALAGQRATDDSVTVCVPAAMKRLLGVTADTTFVRADRELAPTGLNVVGPGPEEEVLISHDARLAVNVNRVSDGAVAEALCD